MTFDKCRAMRVKRFRGAEPWNETAQLARGERMGPGPPRQAPALRPIHRIEPGAGPSQGGPAAVLPHRASHQGGDKDHGLGLAPASLARVALRASHLAGSHRVVRLHRSGAQVGFLRRRRFAGRRTLIPGRRRRYADQRSLTSWVKFVKLRSRGEARRRDSRRDGIRTVDEMKRDNMPAEEGEEG